MWAARQTQLQKQTCFVTVVGDALILCLELVKIHPNLNVFSSYICINTDSNLSLLKMTRSIYTLILWSSQIFYGWPFTARNALILMEHKASPTWHTNCLYGFRGIFPVVIKNLPRAVSLN